MYLLHCVLLIFFFCIVENECCKKVSFVNAVITISKWGSYGETSTTNVTGCITPEILEKQFGNTAISGIKCYNQSIPILYEGAVSNVPEIHYLYIEYSKVKKIKKKSFYNLPNLTSLSLSHNEIEYIDNDAFSGLDALGILDLNINKIAFLEPGVFASLPKLSRIHLSYNELEVFEAEWFPESSVLHTISLDNNFIISIPKNTFKPFKTLNVLELNSNRIQQIHKDAFDNLEQLDTLYLYDNRIKKLEPDVFKGLKNISSVWIHGNNLTYMPDKILDDLNSPNLFQLTIHTNPWQCACYNKIANWATKRDVFIVTRVECYNDNNPVCLYPNENENLCLENIEEDLNKIFYDLYNVGKHECQDEK